VGKLLSFIRIPEKYHSPLVIIFLTAYLVATAFLIAVVRVFVGEMLKLLNKKYRLGFDSLDLLSVNFLFVCLIMPLVPYQYAFILTYITTFSITVARNIFSQYENYFVQSLAISIVSFFITLPIIINISYRVNFLSIIYNLFYIPLVSFIILPLSMIITFVPYLSFLYEILITSFSNSLTILSGIDFMIISFPEPSLVFFILYYALLLIIFAKWENKKMNWKTAAVMILLLIIYKNVRYFNPSDQVVFFDLKEGESTFIGQSFNRCNILIDTGETDNGDLLRYLDAEGITTIHYLIISHGDSDHSGQAVEILKNYYVHNLIYGAYDNSENIEGILRKVGKTRTDTLKAGDILSCGKDVRFQIISPVEDYDNVNKNSLVMVAEIFGIRYLFTGDIDNQVEKIIAKKSRIQVDILKVPHHGSISSSSEAFLKNTGYKMAIIMSGSRNTFGFPSQTVVERFKGKNLFMLSLLV
jgi:competence protein ComEC